MKSYCTQNNGDCKTCSLSNYGRDCQNVLITEKIETIRARTSPEMKERFEKLAAKKGMNASEFLRYLIMNEIEKNENKGSVDNMKKWNRNGYTVKEVEFDYDLHEFEVIKNNEVIATITPGNIEDMKQIISDLDAGADVDGWEDGKGNTIRV